MIVHMCKLRIVTLDEQFDRLIEALQRLGYLHLEPVELEAPRRDGGLHRMQLTELDERRRQVLAEARRNLEELRVAVGDFPEPALTDADAWKRRTPDEIRDAAAEMLHQVRSLRRRRRNLEQDRRVLQRYMRMSHLVPRLGPAEDETEVLLFTFPSEERLVARTLREKLRELEPRRPRLRLFRSGEGNTVAAVVCLADDAARIRDLAWRAGTLEFKLPAAYRSDRLRESFRRVQSDLDAMPRHLGALDSQRDAYRREAGHWAAALELVCAEESQRLEAKQNFIAGSMLRVLHAFLPVDKREEVLRVASEATGDRFEVEDLSLGPRLEEVPVVLQNPGFARPFEVLLRIFPPPTYGTFDPTLVNAVGVPFFFGLIVGDVGYGAILLLLALLVRQTCSRRATIRAAGTIGIYCAVSAMLFGVVYGECFGALGRPLGLRPWIDREDPAALLRLLKIAVCLGALHVGLGLTIGMISARQVLDRHVFRERLGQLFCLAGAVCLGLALFVSPVWLVGALSGLVVGVAMLLWGAGVVGLLEVFSLFSNILSYSRLMALGVASVVLAMVANRIFAKLDYGLAGLMAAVLLHALNIVIATFSPTIHTLRLHYVEFFTKFYRPEGRDYVPFGGRSGVMS